MKIGIYMSFRVVIFAGYMPSNRIAGSYGSFIASFCFLFFFLRNFHTVICRLYQFTSLPTVQAILFTQHPLQHLVFIDFLMMAIMTGVK